MLPDALPAAAENRDGVSRLVGVATLGDPVADTNGRMRGDDAALCSSVVQAGVWRVAWLRRENEAESCGEAVSELA